MCEPALQPLQTFEAFDDIKGKKKGLTHKSIVTIYADVPPSFGIWPFSCQNNLKHWVFWIPVRVENISNHRETFELRVEAQINSICTGLKKESYTTTQQTTQSKHIMTAGSTVCRSHSVCSTHSDGDRAGHRSEVSLDEFGRWSRLKRQNQRHYHMKLLLTYTMNGTDILTLEALRLQ